MPDTFPSMTALEFRLSLRRLVDQAKTGKPIQNHNAWIKASFERNNGPLVTEREIEVRVRQQETSTLTSPAKRRPEPDLQDVDVLRRYLAASPEDRKEIDRLAEGRVARLLTTVSPQQHAGLREQARLESAREFFAKAGEG